MKKEIVIRDRYSVTGTPRPDPKIMCKRCEGMGFYPQRSEAPAANWKFVKCEECKGTRIRQAT